MEALNRAATRAQRRAELEVAKMLVERHLGYEIGETQFGWLSLLSMPQQLADRAACDAAAKSRAKPGGESKLKGPDATTMGGSPGHSWGILVPGSSRIRRSGSGVPNAPSQVDGGAAEEPAAEPTQPTEKRPLDKPRSSRKKKRSKKATRVEHQENNGEGGDQEWENWECQGDWEGGAYSSYHGEGEVSEEGSTPPPPASEAATPVPEEAPPSSTTPGQGQQLAIADGTETVWPIPQDQRQQPRAGHSLHVQARARVNPKHLVRQ
eukprot:s569_g3.t1